jgi:hypothetical protein
MLAAPRGFEPRFTDPKSAVLPLDEGAAGSPSSQQLRLRQLRLRRPAPEVPGQRYGAEDGTRTRDPHLGQVMLYQLSHFRPIATTGFGGAESQNRTGDTAIFSRVLYQLSYLGPIDQRWLPAGAPENTTGPIGPSTRLEAAICAACQASRRHRAGPPRLRAMGPPQSMHGCG